MLHKFIYDLVNQKVKQKPFLSTLFVHGVYGFVKYQFRPTNNIGIFIYNKYANKSNKNKKQRLGFCVLRQPKNRLH